MPVEDKRHRTYMSLERNWIGIEHDIGDVALSPCGNGGCAKEDDDKTDFESSYQHVRFLSSKVTQWFARTKLIRSFLLASSGALVCGLIYLREKREANSSWVATCLLKIRQSSGWHILSFTLDRAIYHLPGPTALPFDVRKAFVPVTMRLSICGEAEPRRYLKMHRPGKAEPFRTSGGRAAR